MKRFAKLYIVIAFAFVFVSTSFATSAFRTINTAQLHSMVVNNAYELEGGRQKQFMVVDARTKKEYEEAHIFSAISVPEDDFGKSKHLLPQDKQVLLIVYGNDAKGDLCRKWADKANAAGYVNTVLYQEGFLYWKEHKMPIAPFSGL